MTAPESFNWDSAWYPPPYLLFDPGNPDHSAARLAAQDRFIEFLDGDVVPLKRLRNGTTLACRLPTEIICHIFTIAQTETGWPHLYRKRQRTPSGEDGKETVYDRYGVDLMWLAVIYVCSRWREAALGSAHLWTKPDDYFALPPTLAHLVRQSARDLPVHLELWASSLRRLRQIGCKPRLPSVDVPIVGLQMHGFSVADFHLFKRGYFRLASFKHLQQLYITIDDIDDEDIPVRLPHAVCLNPAMREVKLVNCVPSRWDVPMLGSSLTRLTLSYDWDRDVLDRMPSVLEFSRILGSATSLEYLNLDNVFPLAVPTIPYPPMLLPPTLKSVQLLCWDNFSRQRDCLFFLKHLVFGHNIHFDVSIGDNHETDVDISQEILSLISSAIHHVYRQQQTPPRHLILGNSAFLTFASARSRSPKRAWPISLLPYIFNDIPDATPLIDFHFHLACVTNASSWHQGSVPVPIRTIRTVSLTYEGARQYLESEVWWGAFKEASDVNRISVFVGDCDALLPLTEIAPGDNAVGAFATFPRLKAIHIRVARPIAADEPPLPNEQECAASLAALQTLVYARRDGGELSRLNSLVVDEKFRAWEIWTTLEADVNVNFCSFCYD